MAESHRSPAGFSVVELMVVIAVLAVITTLVAVSFNRARGIGRDTQRVHDIRTMQTALEIYYAKYRSYPSAVTAGQAFTASGVTYIDLMPSNPLPRTDGNCPNSEYAYSQISANQSYVITFCLGAASGTLTGGTKTAIPGAITP